MTELLKAFYAFWSSFGVPAYLSDQVPDDAIYPYVTYDAVSGAFGEQTETAATFWVNGNVETCADFLNAVKDAIPVSGRLLPVVGSGAAMLYPGTGDFLSIREEMDGDGSKTGVKGARVGYSVQFFCA